MYSRMKHHSVIERIEILDLACYMDGKGRRIEFRYVFDAADSVFKIIPESLDIVPYRGDDSQTCNYNSMLFHFK